MLIESKPTPSPRRRRRVALAAALLLLGCGVAFALGPFFACWVVAPIGGKDYSGRRSERLAVGT